VPRNLACHDPLARPQDTYGGGQALVDCADAGFGVEEQQEEDDARDQGHLRGEAEAEPQDEQWRQRELWHPEGRRKQGLERGAEPGR